MDFSVELCHPDAMIPTRSHATDSGYDLKLVDIKKRVGPVTFYGTGVKVTPPPGFYFDLVARSSLSKTGHLLAIGVGIIDRDYTGEIIAPLLKVDPLAPDVTLPDRLVQLIPRAWHDMQPVVVDQLPVKTARGDGSFGSTSEK